MNNFNVDRLSGFWARQLHAEFSEICWKYNIEMTSPVFEISKSAKQLGSWHAGARTIKISASLIVNYSWSVTLNVLKHEIAHQICSEIFKSNEKAHGPAFSKACDLLSLPEEYKRAGGDLPSEVELIAHGTKLTSKGRSFIAKVEKLLALAQSSNENEAILAMQKANELIEKHNITHLAESHDASYTYVIINKKRKRIESYQRKICTILRDFFFVKIITSYLYDPLSNDTHKTIEILGSHENVVIAEYCYHFLESRLVALWSQNRHRYKGSVRTEKNSYYMGLLSGFYDKLHSQREKKQATSKPQNRINSLVVAEDQRLNNYVSMRFPRLTTISRRGPRIYKGTYEAGVETGKKINLHKGVSRKDGNRGNLIA
jgi:hypothetical protein